MQVLSAYVTAGIALHTILIVSPGSCAKCIVVGFDKLPDLKVQPNRLNFLQ